MGCLSSTPSAADEPMALQNTKTGNWKAPQSESELSGIERFNDAYKIGKALGEGAFSVVREATNRHTNESFAVKVITKEKLSQEDEDALKDEISILKSLKHQNIICLYKDYNEPTFYYLVTEMMQGGELFDRIVAKTAYNEKDSRDVCKILFEAIAYCHSQGIAHRDLKPENLLLMSKTNDRDIKIADFGFATKVTSEECLLTQCGTPGYVAPEILRGVPYGQQADMWSLGVIAYILIGGYPPFIEQNQRELFRKIKRGAYEFHVEYWGQISREAKDLISALLTVDPKQRLSAQNALKNQWITGSDDYLVGQDLRVNLEKFKKYNAVRKLRGAVLVLMATNKMTSLGNEFRTNLA